MSRGRAGTVLDRVLPAWDWNEYHSVKATAASDQVIDAVDALTWNDVPLFRRIMTTVSFYVGFLRARHTPDILDFEGDPVTALRDVSPAGTVKVAMNFLYRDGLLSTETRCQAKDRFTARAFGVYWLLIRVGSGVIRRSWLKGITRTLRDSNRGAPSQRPESSSGALPR